jgi:hypothetical protein
VRADLGGSEPFLVRLFCRRAEATIPLPARTLADWLRERGNALVLRGWSPAGQRAWAVAHAWAERTKDARERQADMKVVGHDTWVVHIPYDGHRAATHIVLQLNTDEGAQGVSYLTPLVPWTVAPIRASIDALMEKVHGANPMAVESINAALLARTLRPQFDGLARSAVSLIDIALWDLKAKALSQPLFPAGRIHQQGPDPRRVEALSTVRVGPRDAGQDRPRARGPWLPCNEIPRGLRADKGGGGGGNALAARSGRQRCRTLHGHELVPNRGQRDSARP